MFVSIYALEDCVNVRALVASAFLLPICCASFSYTTLRFSAYVKSIYGACVHVRVRIQYVENTKVEFDPFQGIMLLFKALNPPVWTLIQNTHFEA